MSPRIAGNSVDRLMGRKHTDEDKSAATAPAPPLRVRLLRLAAKLSISLVTIVLLLIVAEVATRMFSTIQPPLGLRHPVLGKTYRPDHETTMFVNEAGREISLRFNREGFRGKNLPYEKEQGVRRLAVLGDSFVAAIGCEESDTSVAVLQDLLQRSHSEVTWEAMNFGVSGSSTGQQIVLFREIVSRYDPDLVLVAFYIGNDFADNSSEMSTVPRIYFQLDEAGNLVQKPGGRQRLRWSAWLNRYSRFYIWQKYATDRATGRARQAVRPVLPRDRVFDSEPDETLRGVWSLIERILEAIHEEVKGTGAQMALLLLPSPTQIYDDGWEELARRVADEPGVFDRDYPDSRLAEFCAAKRIPMVSLTPAFRRIAGDAVVADTPKEELLFFGGTGHFSERGNRVAAEEIHRFLTAGPGRVLLEDAWSPAS
jgi:hypothetical protein